MDTWESHKYKYSIGFHKLNILGCSALWAKQEQVREKHLSQLGRAGVTR